MRSLSIAAALVGMILLAQAATAKADATVSVRSASYPSYYVRTYPGLVPFGVVLYPPTVPGAVYSRGHYVHVPASLNPQYHYIAPRRARVIVVRSR